jgi:hypothetical protein
MSIRSFSKTLSTEGATRRTANTTQKDTDRHPFLKWDSSAIFLCTSGKDPRFTVDCEDAVMARFSCVTVD